MDQIAIFVDAGYLFAQGSAALFGAKQARSNLVLNSNAAISLLKGFARARAPSSKLLRIYWYDGSIAGTRLTTDQAVIAGSDDVKLRLGFLNSAGQQKGVDSLIVTDMIELARLKSIDEAVLLSGDEDVRIGVQIAQSYGVRVHLLGIAPSRSSQAPQLIQEADTTAEWTSQEISQLLSLRIAAADLETEAAELGDKLVAADPIEKAAALLVDALQQTDIDAIAAYWTSNRGVPSEFDRKLLPACRSALGRDLDQAEKREARTHFQRLVRLRLAG